MDPSPAPFPAPGPLDPAPAPDPGFFGGLAAIFGAGFLVLFLVWAGLVFLGILGFYWLIRLAVRHAMMDAARWQATGTVKKPKGFKAPPSGGLPVYRERPRGPRDW